MKLTRQHAYLLLAAVAVAACPIVALLGSNSEATIISGYIAGVFAILFWLSHLKKQKEQLARVIAWAVRIVSVPFLWAFLFAAFLLSPINSKLDVDFTAWDRVWAWLWNGLLLTAAIALWWLLHSELKRATKNEERA